VSPPVEPEPAPVVKPRTFIAEPMGTSPKLEVAEDARLFRRADDRGEWVMPKDLADPGQVARRLGDATVKPQERHNQILLGAAKVAKLVPVTDHAPFTVSIDTADLVTGLGARVGQSFDQLLALVPALKCSPEFGEDYQQLNCDTPDGWTAIFPSKGHDFAKLEWTGTSEQARGLIGRNRLEMLSWSGRPSP
jgi:hypothetical protein